MAWLPRYFHQFKQSGVLFTFYNSSIGTVLFRAVSLRLCNYLPDNSIQRFIIIFSFPRSLKWSFQRKIYKSSSQSIWDIRTIDKVQYKKGLLEKVLCCLLFVQILEQLQPAKLFRYLILMDRFTLSEIRMELGENQACFKVCISFLPGICHESIIDIVLISSHLLAREQND